MKGLLFIKVDDKIKDKIDVNEIARHIVEKIKTTGEQLSRLKIIKVDVFVVSFLLK